MMWHYHPTIPPTCPLRCVMMLVMVLLCHFAEWVFPFHHDEAYWVLYLLILWDDPGEMVRARWFREMVRTVRNKTSFYFNRSPVG
jgi:hypothetical protein